MEISRPFDVGITSEIAWKLARIAEAENKLTSSDPTEHRTTTSSTIACRILKAEIDQEYPLLDEFWQKHKQAKEDAVKALSGQPLKNDVKTTEL